MTHFLPLSWAVCPGSVSWQQPGMDDRLHRYCRMTLFARSCGCSPPASFETNCSSSRASGRCHSSTSARYALIDRQIAWNLHESRSCCATGCENTDQSLSPGGPHTPWSPQIRPIIKAPHCASLKVYRLLSHSHLHQFRGTWPITKPWLHY